MIHLRQSSRLLGIVAGAACFLCGAAGFAELPPLTPEEQAEQAAVIVRGKVRSVRNRTVVRPGEPGFVDEKTSASFQVTAVEKGTGVRPGTAIQVHYWRAKQRPRGWAGPGGQSQPLQPGKRAKLFLKQAGKRFELLMPNGWTAVK